MEPIQKHTLNLFEGDFARLGELYPELPKSQILRVIVREHIKAMEDRIKDGLPEIEIKLPEGLQNVPTKERV